MRGLRWVVASAVVVAEVLLQMAAGAVDAPLIRTFQVGSDEAIRALAFSSDGTILAIRQIRTPISLWDADTGTRIRGLGQTEASTMAVSPVGGVLAAAHSDAAIRVWDVNTGAVVETLAPPGTGVIALAFSTDGSMVAGAGGDGEIKVWNVADGALTRRLVAGVQSVMSVAWSPDGLTLVSGSWGDGVRLWNGSNGAAIRTLAPNIGGPELPSHIWQPRFLALSPDGSRLWTGDQGGWIELWDAYAGTHLLTFSDRPNRGTPASMVLSQHG